MKKLFILMAVLAILATVIKVNHMGQAGQAPIPAENASFLHKDTSLTAIYSGTMTVSKAANEYNAGTSYTHNLGYSPAFIAYAFDGSTYRPVEHIIFDVTTGLPLYQYTCQSLPNQFTCEIRTLNSGTYYTNPLSATFKFYLFKEEAN